MQSTFSTQALSCPGMMGFSLDMWQQCTHGGIHQISLDTLRLAVLLQTSVEPSEKYTLGSIPLVRAGSVYACFGIMYEHRLVDSCVFPSVVQSR